MGEILGSLNYVWDPRENPRIPFFVFCLALAFTGNAGNPFNVYVWGIVLRAANGYVKFNLRNKKIGDKYPLFIKDF